ncbi:MarR family transcriptional regulator [Nocardia vinacea]|uniref:MarR family transcriptional regulator n=1 Tax=Nocardia vinacea TaxID=96468 RepID=UPI001FDF0937
MPPSTTTRVVDRLEQAGYLRRVAAPNDRRKVLWKRTRPRWTTCDSDTPPWPATSTPTVRDSP